VRPVLIALLLLTACNQKQVKESDQAVVAERAKTLQKTADASVDESIAQMTREGLEESADNGAAVK
jgi:hypothetical protein